MEYMGVAEAEEDTENGEEEKVGDDVDDIGVDNGATFTASDKLKVEDVVFSPSLCSTVSVRSDV